MLNRFDVSFEGDYVLARTEGDKDYVFLEELWANIALTCEKHNCFKVLGVAATQTPVEAVEGYELPRIFHDNSIDERYRIAWVELNLDAADTLSFIAGILSNRGLPGRQFDDVGEAREWLLGQSAT